MLKVNALNIVFTGIWLAVCTLACNNTGVKPVNNATLATYQHLITAQIVAGKRLENIDNDSMKIVSQKLYRLNKLSGDKVALVYADLYGALYLWQAAEHKNAMQGAVKALADAQRLNVKAPLPQIYALIGNLHKETTNYPMAFKAADSGLDAAIRNTDTASIISLLGLKAMFTRGLSLNRHQPQLDDKSSDLNLEALKMAEASPKYERLRIRFYDNLCQYYKDKRDFDRAFYYGNKGVGLALKYNQKRSLTYAYCWLGQASYFHGEQAKGISYLNQALQIARDLHEPYRVMEINEAFADCYLSSGNYKEAFQYNNLARNMRDSLKVLDNTRQISDLQLKYESSQKDKEITALNAKTQLASIRFKGIAVILFLLIVISILIYIREKNGKKLLLSEKFRVDGELKRASLELLYFTENLKQKNEIIEEFKTEVEHLHTRNNDQAHTESLDKLLNLHIMTDENWDNFKKLFTKVHSRFFSFLRKEYPNLTSTDTRMLALVKLQLDNREIAPMLGITVEGVRKSKHRLRKKMDLPEDKSLEDVVSAI